MSNEAWFPRLPYPKTKTSQLQHLTMGQFKFTAKMKAGWGERPWEARCDAPPSDGFSGGPVLDREGQAVGMLADRSGDADKSFINGVFTTSEGLIHALALIEGSKSWKRWGLKAVVGATSFLSKEQESSTPRKRPAYEDEPEDNPETKRIATDTLQQEYRPANLPTKEYHVSKPSWRPSVVVKGPLVWPSGGKGSPSALGSASQSRTRLWACLDRSRYRYFVTSEQKYRDAVWVTSVSNFKDQNRTGTRSVSLRMSIHPSLSLSRSHTIFRVTINYSPPPTVHYFDEPPAPTPAVKIIHHETRQPVHQKLNLRV
ncbi:hypothetical protein FN846DRAFT_1018149 [Sphaerosporella brunnea]|uniref:Uncharacterized protein n=1 Tax=Sphaerosporella brunnea TaxID=1250544 RepID=A0A5J5FCD4_9PEZI|nr:hypothetical protein FN846DRAFT_1018149 [Sphaerosporella brunnea]